MGGGVAAAHLEVLAHEDTDGVLRDTENDGDGDSQFGNAVIEDFIGDDRFGGLPFPKGEPYPNNDGEDEGYPELPGGRGGFLGGFGHPQHEEDNADGDEGGAQIVHFGCALGGGWNFQF